MVSRNHPNLAFAVESLAAARRARVTNTRAALTRLLTAALVLLLGSAADAATITVNSLADPGRQGICALRDAITAANSQTRVNGCKAGSGNDTINFSVSGTIMLLGFQGTGSGRLEITDSQLTINGPIAISGHEPGGCAGLISVASGATVKVKNLTLESCLESEAILNEGTLTIASSTVMDSKFPTFNFGTMTVTDSTFTRNFGDAGFGPTAIDNEAGGILSINNSTISDNVDPPIMNFGLANIANSTFFGNEAISSGAIENFQGAVLTLTNSTFTENFSELFGAISNSGELTIISSTFAGNSGTEGFLSFSPVGNIDNTGSLTVKNSILATSIDASGTPIPNCLGTITDAGYNISDDGSCGFVKTGTANNGDNVNPMLSSDGLTNNGGPTQTIALAGDSPALDAIPLADCTDQNGKRLKTDQRGFPRPDAGENVCDIGAFETQDGCANPQGNNNCQ